MRTVESWVIWGLFLGSSVFGHVALKHASGTSAEFNYRRALTMWTDPWALGAMSSWALSCLLWGLLLTRYNVGQATGTSSLRYVLILMAAVLWLGEPMQWRQGIGCAMIAVGIWLVSQ